MPELKMPNLNQLTVSGRLTQDPDVTSMASGQDRAYFRIAVNRSYRVGEEWKEETSFFSVVAWGHAATRAGENLSKGDPVIIEGRLRSYDPPAGDDGERRASVVEITAQRVVKLTSNGDSNGHSSEEDRTSFPPESTEYSDL